MRRSAAWLVTLSVPVVLTMVVVRLVTLPWYPAWQYGRLGFPADIYGLPAEDRLRLASATIGFLNVFGSDDALGRLVLPGGDPAYNDRELSHMDDVKRVYDGLTAAAAVALLVGTGSVWYLRRGGDVAVWRALGSGAGATLALLVALGVWMVAGFDRFFTLFHGLFFEEGTWLFYTSDTLIRLFPLPFWRDAGLIVAGIVTMLALGLLAVSRAMARRAGSTTH